MVTKKRTGKITRLFFLHTSRISKRVLNIKLFFMVPEWEEKNPRSSIPKSFLRNRYRLRIIMRTNLKCGNKWTPLFNPSWIRVWNFNVEIFTRCKNKIETQLQDREKNKRSSRLSPNIRWFRSNIKSLLNQILRETHRWPPDNKGKKIIGMLENI